ncbi:MAG: hypothetical protein AAF368_20550, partial [Planctomycetota bacterium]
MDAYARLAGLAEPTRNLPELAEQSAVVRVLAVHLASGADGSTGSFDLPQVRPGRVVVVVPEESQRLTEGIQSVLNRFVNDLSDPHEP